MEKIVVYKCEICGNISENLYEILECEASHFGLSVEEKTKWDKLVSACAYWKCVSEKTDNEQVQLKYKKVFQERIMFEEAHNLKPKENSYEC